MKIVSRVITIIAAALVALLAVANREAATVSLDPLPFEITGPLYALLLAAAVIGLSVGGFMGWSSGLKWRRMARRRRRELDSLEKRLKTSGVDLGAENAPHLPAEDQSTPQITVKLPPA
jgi:uncharacterized integral membrane protein